jgi:hypothetical protein
MAEVLDGVALVTGGGRGTGGLGPVLDVTDRAAVTGAVERVEREQQGSPGADPRGGVS